MPIISGSIVNLAANATSAEQIAGPYEFLPYNATVDVYCVISATGINAALLASADTVIDDRPIHAIGTTINKSDHLLTTFEAAGGSRLSLRFRETAAAATTDILWIVEINPL